MALGDLSTHLLDGLGIALGARGGSIFRNRVEGNGSWETPLEVDGSSFPRLNQY